MASVTAWIALFSWPAIAGWLFRAFTLQNAVLAILICGYLLLPERVEVDLPALPSLNKHSIPALIALFLVWLAARDPSKSKDFLPGWLPRDKPTLLLMALLYLGTMGTVLTNLDVVYNGSVRQPGMRVYDGLSLALALLIIQVPFLLGRKCMSVGEGPKRLVTFMVIAAVAYTFLALWEVRMSPQLNRQLYGFFAHSWIQHIRNDGFRPIVFLQHGLFVGIFFCCAALMAFGMARVSTGQQKLLFMGAGAWLLLTIMLCKVLGAFGITLLFLPAILFLPRRILFFMTFGVAVIVMSYPALRNVDLIPTDRAIEIAEQIDPARAQSLEFRILNEDKLLDRAKQRPLFGWGGWARNRVYNEAGEDVSITDGRWVILFGVGGWARYIGEFGLLLIVIFRLPFAPKDHLHPLTFILAVALAANMIDLIPNSGVTSLTWLIAGTLVGLWEQRGQKLQTTEEPPDTVPSQTSRYARNLGPPKYGRGASSYHRNLGSETEPARSRQTARKRTDT